jgi:hypothetical protein
MTQRDLFTKELNKAQLEMLGRMGHTLTNMGCQWVIVTPDGEKYGNMREEDKNKRRPLKHPFGAKTAYVRPYMETLEVGQVAEIPVGGSGFDATEVINACSSLACRLWGNGQATSAYNSKTNMVEVLRTGGM